MKKHIYKPKNMINKDNNAKRVYPINKDFYNIVPPKIIDGKYGDGNNQSNEAYYWIGYYDTFLY